MLGDKQSAEELELQAKLARLTASMADAHASVVEAKKLISETEQMALEAELVAEQARQEAERIRVGKRLRQLSCHLASQQHAKCIPGTDLLRQGTT